MEDVEFITRAEALATYQQNYRESTLSLPQAILDSYAHVIFDEDDRLSIEGGWYVIENLRFDLLKRFPELDECGVDLEFGPALESAERWCKRRSRWYSRARYWVQPCSNWLIIKHDRFWTRSNRR